MAAARNSPFTRTVLAPAASTTASAQRSRRAAAHAENAKAAKRLSL